jgi:glycosyltransferase involved in cell wall biosynthesis
MATRLRRAHGRVRILSPPLPPENLLMSRILHIITGLSAGGAEMALYRLIVSSRGGSYTHSVVTLTSGGSMRQRFLDAGIEVVTLDFKRSPISQFIRLLALIRRIRPDIVQTWMYHADMLGGLAARMAGNRNVVWGIRTTSIQKGAYSIALIRRMCAWLSWWVPHTIVCAAEASRQSHAVAGYDSMRMVVVQNGFDLAAMAAPAAQKAALRTQCGFAPDDIVVGCVGRFDVDKDFRNFVRAAGLLAQQHSHVRFLMVGPGLDKANAELAGWIAETGHAARFVLLGERADAPVCLASMDVFCLSSRNEGFPNVVGEAMGMDVPCVVTDVGDAALLVADTGVIVPKEDPHALANGIADLLAMTPAARKQLGQRARERVQSEFTMKRVRERFESLYQLITRESAN